MEISKQQFVLLVIVSVGVLFGLLYSGRSDEFSSPLTTEFTNAYFPDISPSGKVREFSLLAGETSIELIDDFTTTAWSYNAAVPGPELRVQKGDTVRVNFRNNLSQPTTIHWHGVRVPNAMDGVPGVTQDPIQPGEDFTYEFTPKDAGTFWYHPHVRSSEQVERGLYGTLIVEDPGDPLYDIDQVLVVDDWSLASNGQVNPAFNTMHDLVHDGRWGSTITVNGKQGYNLDVRPGQRLRLRFVNPSNGRVYRLDFGGLEANVIAVDGMKVGTTFLADSFELAPGNRLDVDIAVPLDAQKKNFAITDTFVSGRTGLVTLAVAGDPVTPKSFEVPVASYFPQWAGAAAEPITQEYVLNIAHGMHRGVAWTINGAVFPNGESIMLQEGVFQKIRFTNDSSNLHPMHLHGQFFKVVARNGNPVNEPYWRDTVLVHPKEQVDVALVPLDKGVWVSHCHVLEHAEAGMMTTIEVQ